MAKRHSSSKRNQRSSGGLLSFIVAVVRAMRNDPQAGEKSRKILALVLIGSSIFSIIAFLSYFFTGNSDQSVVATEGIIAQETRNWLGFLGAWIADLMVRRGFGILSFLIPLYTLFWGLVILEDEYYHYVRQFFKYVFFILLWGATFLAFFAILINQDNPNYDLGGGVGDYINYTLFSYIGKPGVAFLLLVSLAVFLVNNFNTEISASLFVSKIQDAGKNVSSKTKTIQSKTIEIQAETKKLGLIGSIKKALTPAATADDEEEYGDEEEEEILKVVAKEKKQKQQESSTKLIQPSRKNRPLTAAERQEKGALVKADTVQNADEFVYKKGSEIDLDKLEKPEEERSRSMDFEPPKKRSPFIRVEQPPAINEPQLIESQTPDKDGQLKWEVSLGDEELDEETLNRLSNRKPANPSFEIVNREILGEDNVERVIDSKGNDHFEKIINEEDEEMDNPDEAIDWELYDPTKELSDYQRPPFELLEDHGGGKGREVNRAELEENKNKIVKVLKDFGIEIQSIKATIGPTVTLYEIVPAAGVRISKIRNLEDDIALNLAALGIRIIAPMPGKGTIGIEIPNSTPEIVSLRSVLSTEKYLTSKSELPIVIGRTISNEVYIVDLNKLPHLLIAGSTGQGKSVGINTIITSLLYRKHPAEVKFVLIDPKKVELNLYQPLQHHFLAVLPDQTEPTITDTKDAIAVLKSLCVEMDNRYMLLKSARVRNLKEYNEKFMNRRLNPRKGHKFLPYIVLIIDELADMMMIAGKEVETPIARLAQLARAVGIHLVVATQRPSVNVITGIIKANFPARLSYRVISKVDSRTILDANGADQLIGRGDLLLYMGSEIIRIQNAFIDTPEVQRVVDFIAEQRGFPEPYLLPEAPTEDSKRDEEEFQNDGERDAMFEEAARVVVRYQLGSASLIQRKLKLGYARAGRIIDQLERAGIVGSHSGSKAREVLITDEAMLERFLANLL